ncbi:MAG TPA: hypothetical protein VMH02_06495 [Verrucomicrobiae bacterium]|nr:hypothetical protein [Verrucomicrobiae bacterium]
MEWEELLAEFRALGGTAENVRLADGPFGRGVFVVDPAKPATLHAPKTLLVPAAAVELCDGQMRVRPDAPVGARERDFFERYERHFGWGAGAYDELRRAQEEWRALPRPVVEFLTSMGGLEDPDRRFAEPTPRECFERFIGTRMIRLEDAPQMMPLVDLVNHFGRANGYAVDGGVGVTGVFAGEMLVRYNRCDAWADAMTYGFAARSLFAYSIGISVDVFGERRLTIRRDVGQTDVRDGVAVPRIAAEGDSLLLPFMLLANSLAMDLPRGIFRKVTERHLSPSNADEAFEMILHFNRTKFLDLLQLLRKHEGRLVRVLEQAAIDHLYTLCDCIGTRTL